MAEAVPPELVEQCSKALLTHISEDVVQTSKLSRPPVKILQAIFAGLSDATGFPDPAIIKREEFPKEAKEERVQYIDMIIQITGEAVGSTIECAAKNITAGKEVAQTLNFLIKMAEAADKNKNASAPPPAPQPVAQQIVEIVPAPAVVSQQQFVPQQQQHSSVDAIPESVDELVPFVAKQLSSVGLNDDVISEAKLSRPPVKVLQGIFSALSDTTGFPDPSKIVRDEFPKEQKQERLDYIQSIIQMTSDAIGEDINCDAKNITGGKEVEQTLKFLCKLTQACKQAKQSAPQTNVDTPAAKFDPASSQNFGTADQSATNAGVDFFGAPAPAPVPMSFQPTDEKPAVSAPAKTVSFQPSYQSEVINQEDEERRFKEAELRQQEMEAKQQSIIAETMHDINATEKRSGAPVKSQAQKRRGQTEEQQQANVLIKRKNDDSSDDEEERERERKEEEAVNSTVNAMFAEKEGDAQNFFGGDGGADGEAGGAFSKDAAKQAANFNSAVSGGDKNIIQQKVSNQANSKLIVAIQNAVRGVIPFSKATSFLEEHLVRMRQDLMLASDDCVQQEQVQQKFNNLDNKNKSVQDAKLRAVLEQTQAVRQSYAEMIALGAQWL